jgi:uracil DNA glycosylase
MNLESFSIGGGNLQFVTIGDISSYLNLTDEDDPIASMHRYLPESNITNVGNTLSANMTAGNLQNTGVILHSNIMIFGMFRRIDLDIRNDPINIIIRGHPFNGVFNANTTISFSLEADLENEQNSRARIVLDIDTNVETITQTANQILYEWADQIIRNYNHMLNQQSRLNSEIEVVDNEFSPESDCSIVSR